MRKEPLVMCVTNVVASVEGGVTCVQCRDTESANDERFARVRRLQDALRKFGTTVIVNNDADLAAAVKAQGVHVGQSDMPPEQVRQIVGPNCEIGLSITDISQLAAVNRSCVDCLGIGPVFDARKTKADASDAMGVPGLAEIVAATNCHLPSTLYPLSTSHRRHRWHHACECGGSFGERRGRTRRRKRVLEIARPIRHGASI